MQILFLSFRIVSMVPSRKSPLGADSGKTAFHVPWRCCCHQSCPSRALSPIAAGRFVCSLICTLLPFLTCIVPLHVLLRISADSDKFALRCAWWLRKPRIFLLFWSACASWAWDHSFQVREFAKMIRNMLTTICRQGDKILKIHDSATEKWWTVFVWLWEKIVSRCETKYVLFFAVLAFYFISRSHHICRRALQTPGPAWSSFSQHLWSVGLRCSNMECATSCFFHLNVLYKLDTQRSHV